MLKLHAADSFTLSTVTYETDEGDYLSPGMQEEVFTQVPDAMLLQGVDAQQLATIQLQADTLLREQGEQLQNIGPIDNYAGMQENVVETPAYQTSHSVNHDLQAVLDSPLPEGLAEFSTFHATTNINIPSPSYQTQSPAQYTGSPHPSLATQSPLQSPLVRHDSPGFPYPTPPASHEGQSPCFNQNTILHPMVSPKQNDFGQVVSRDIDEPPQASSPLSAAFFTSTMSSSAAVEQALEEVLPGETMSNDDIYPLTNSPTPHSPIPVGLTPVPSPLPNIATTSVASPHQNTTYTPSSNNVSFTMSPQYTLQSQMMPNSEDPLLSSSPKDFPTKKRFEFNGLPLKVISNNGLIDLNSTHFTGILVDANGEIKLIQTGGSALQGKNFILSNAAPLVTTAVVQESTSKDDELRSYLRAPKLFKAVQYAIPMKQLQTRPKINAEKKNETGDVFLSPTT